MADDGGAPDDLEKWTMSRVVLVLVGLVFAFVMVVWAVSRWLDWSPFVVTVIALWAIAVLFGGADAFLPITWTAIWLLGLYYIVHTADDGYWALILGIGFSGAILMALCNS